jgi:hypothetical protein
MIAIGGAPYSVRDDYLLRWSFEGYTEMILRQSVAQAALITPPLFVAILRRGYRPRWHESVRPLAAA